MEIIKIKTVKIIFLLILALFLILCDSSSDDSKKNSKENKNNKEADLVIAENSNASENKIKEEKYKKNLLGTWYPTPQPLDEGDEHYIFYKDGTFIRKTSVYDGENRTLDKAGKWDIIYGNLLVLNVTSTTVIEGGEFVISPSSSYGWALSGGKKVKREFSKPIITIYPLGEIEIDKSVPNPVTMRIGGIQFWKLNAKPEDIVE
jgi:hypothetical protein